MSQLQLNERLNKSGFNFSSSNQNIFKTLLQHCLQDFGHFAQHYIDSHLMSEPWSVALFAPEQLYHILDQLDNSSSDISFLWYICRVCKAELWNPWDQVKAQRWCNEGVCGFGGPPVVSSQYSESDCIVLLSVWVCEGTQPRTFHFRDNLKTRAFLTFQPGLLLCPLGCYKASEALILDMASTSVWRLRSQDSFHPLQNTRLVSDFMWMTIRKSIRKGMNYISTVAKTLW